MKNILSPQNRHALEQFASSNMLLAFDYDGTLAPIVADPSRAQLRASTRRLLEDLTKLYPCIVISGRAQDDVLRRLHGTGVREVIGNHGLEPWHASNPLLEQVQAWVPVLERRLGRQHGIEIENKLFSLAVHYRRAREKRKARKSTLSAVEGLDRVRIIGGKMVLNLLPDGAPHKGMALERARERFGCDTAIYVGDDETDEDVFGLDQPERLLTVRVGPSRASRADYCVRSQLDVDELIRLLLELRSTRRARRARA